jgi:hypothetical protein
MTTRSRTLWISTLALAIFAGSSPLTADAGEAPIRVATAPDRDVAAGPDTAGDTRLEGSGGDPGELDASGTGAQEDPATQTEGLPRWVPRKRGKPAARVGGATRGISNPIVVRALVPHFDDAAVTIVSQPVLFWQLSATTDYGVNFTLIDPAEVDAIVDVTLPGPFEAGINRVALSDYGAHLDPGRTYEWFVALVPDPTRRSLDIVTRGAVRRLVPEADLEQQLAGTAGAERTNRLAAAGIWYDALDAIEDEVAAAPSDRTVLARRSALLEQAGVGK